MIMIAVLALAFLIAVTVCYFKPNGKIMSYVSIGATLVAAISVIILAVDMSDSSWLIDFDLFYIDKLSLIFMALVAFVSVMAMMYSDGYMANEVHEGAITERDLRNYYIITNLFIMVMYMTFVVRSIAVIWVCVGATTLVSTYLVGFYRNDNSTEAAWKYIMICCVGVTLALVGITLMYASAVDVISNHDSVLDWPMLMLHATECNPDLMKMATVLLIIGFGTKVGFAPMHTWLPDAHSQAPTPVSGMLSAVLLNCAFYAIIRIYMVAEQTIPGFPRSILLVFGLLSLFVAACFIIISRDIKRMFAYSSIENMGLIAIGFGIGTELAIFAAIFQMIAHSITKPLLFFCAGDIIQSYDTRRMDYIIGVRKSMPFTAFMLAAGTLIMVGVPPFAIFAGEFNLIMALISQNQLIIMIIVLILLLIIFAGMVLHIFPILSGEPPSKVRDQKGKLRHAPFVIIFAVTLALGLFVPDQLLDYLHSVASMIGGLA